MGGGYLQETQNNLILWSDRCKYINEQYLVNKTLGTRKFFFYLRHEIFFYQNTYWKDWEKEKRKGIYQKKLVK